MRLAVTSQGCRLPGVQVCSLCAKAPDVVQGERSSQGSQQPAANPGNTEAGLPSVPPGLQQGS